LNRFDPDRLTSALREALGDSVRDPVSARVGHPTTREVLVPEDEAEQAGMIYIHGVGSNLEGVATAVNTVLAPEDLIPDAPIEVVQDTGTYRVVGKDRAFWNEFIADLKIPDQRVVSIDQIEWGSLRPTSPEATMQAVVSGATYTLDGTRYHVAAQLTKDFMSDIPVTAGEALAILVTLDPTTGTLSYTNGATYNGSVPHEQALSEGLWPTSVGTAVFAKGWVVLRNGTSELRPGRNIFAAPEYLYKRSSGVNNIITSEGRVVVDSSGEVVTA